MSEDYTWDETVTAHGYAVQNAGLRRDNATLAARVMELEAQLANAQERQSAQFGRNTARLADVALDAERQTQRVQELERENAELRADWVDKNDVLMQSLQVIEMAEEFKQRAETAEARLAAVPIAAIRYMLAPFANGGTSWAESETHMNTLTTWVKAQQAQPADAPDAPLTLAQIDDEDGDE